MESADGADLGLKLGGVAAKGSLCMETVIVWMKDVPHTGRSHRFTVFYDVGRQLRLKNGPALHSATGCEATMRAAKI